MPNNESGFWESALSPEGRNGRGRFWLIAVLSGLAGLVGAFALVTLAGMVGAGDAALLFALPVTLVVFVIGVINRVRRLHDLGRSGWWMLLFLAVELPLSLLAYVPAEGGGHSHIKGVYALYSLAMLILFGTIPGQPHPNRYGDPPAPAARPPAEHAAWSRD